MAYTEEQKKKIRAFQEAYKAADAIGDEEAKDAAHAAADEVRGFHTITVNENGKLRQRSTKKLWSGNNPNYTSTTGFKEAAAAKPTATTPTSTLNRAKVFSDILNTTNSEKGTPVNPSVNAVSTFAPENGSKVNEFYDARKSMLPESSLAIKKPLNINSIQSDKMDNTVKNTILAKSARENTAGAAITLNPSDIAQSETTQKESPFATTSFDRLRSIHEPKTSIMEKNTVADKMVQDAQYQANGPKTMGKFVSTNVWNGLDQLNSGLAKFFDWLLPTEFAGQYDFIDPVLNRYKDVGTNSQKKADYQNDTQAKGVVGNLISGTVQAIPNAVLAIASGGTSLSGTIGQTAATGTSKVSQIAGTLSTVVKDMGKNTMFWTSFAQIAGTTYEEELANGANEFEASASALINGILGSAIEIGGGIEKFNPAQGWLKTLLRTSGEEGLEEVEQYSLQNLVNKAIGSDTAEWGSFDPNQAAVINPGAQAIQGAYGAAIGGIIGGSQQGASGIINTLNGNAAQQKGVSKLFNSFGLKEDYTGDNFAEMNTRLFSQFVETANAVQTMEETWLDDEARTNLSAINDILKTAIKNSAVVPAAKPLYEALSGKIDSMLSVEQPKPIEPEAVLVEEPTTEKTPISATEIVPQEQTLAENENVSETQGEVAEIASNVAPVAMPIFKETMYRGKGKTAEQIYSGVKYPVLGEGAYYAFNPEDASNYGDEIEARDVEMQNPIIIRDDSDWATLTKAAGWKHTNPYGLSEEETVNGIKRLKDYIQTLGHDGVIVKYIDDIDGDTNGKTGGWIKTLDNVFGHDQAVSYAEEPVIKESKAQEDTQEKISTNTLTNGHGREFTLISNDADSITVEDDKGNESKFYRKEEWDADGKKAFAVKGASKGYEILVDPSIVSETPARNTPDNAGSAPQSEATPIQEESPAEAIKNAEKPDQAEAPKATETPVEGESAPILQDDIEVKVESTKAEKVPASLMKQISAIVGDGITADSKKELKDFSQEAYNESDIDEQFSILLDGIKGLTAEEEVSSEVKEVINHVRNTKLKLTDSIKSNITDFEAFRKRNISTLRLANEGSEVDTFFSELNEIYPGYFDDEITHPAQMLENISETVNKLRQKTTFQLGDMLTNADVLEIYVLPIMEAMNSKGEGATDEQRAGEDIKQTQSSEGNKQGESASTDGSENQKNGKAESKTEKWAKQIVADQILTKIKQQEKFSSQELFDICNQAFGGTQAEGVYDVKTAYDCMELAVNQYLIENAAHFKSGTKEQATESIKSLENLQSLLPTQGSKRNEKMEQYQQFSTPPAIAFLADYVANVQKGETVLEPSAGIGGLVALPKGWGAKVHVNELEESRYDTIQNLPFDGFTRENAEQINNILPESLKPTLIIMNPPFSTAATRTGNKRDTGNAKRHIEQALLKLEEGGRLVAIVGRGMADNTPTFKYWWDQLRKKYDIKANIQINGENYKKYGTTFDIQMVVIDKIGKTIEPTITGVYDELTDALNVLEGIRNERTPNDAGIEREAVVIDSEVSTGQSGRNGSTSVSSADGSTENVPNDNKQPGSVTDKPSDRGDSGSSSNASSAETVSGNGRTGRTGYSEENQANGDKEGQTRSSDDSHSGEYRGESLEQLESKPVSNDVVESEDDVYNVYKAKKLNIKGVQKHPTDLVESAAMSAVDAPDLQYIPKLDKKLIENGGLSDAQLEAISYAGQIHEKILPDGRRQGFFIGDGTGVGKGREISGIIMDNFNHGRKKAVWVSKNKDLFKDAVRDITDLGMSKDDIFDLSDTKTGNNVNKKNGILFTTYDTLRSSSKKEPTQTRMKQIIDYFGKDFDGVIIFDESHNMGNAQDSGSGFSKKKAAGKALAGLELQDALPNARIVYASATGATEVNNLSYLTRLGLWGMNTAFNNVRDFTSKIGSGGLAAMELVARDMKALGLYTARNLSFKGVEYDTLEHELTPMQEEIYDEMCKAWQLVFKNIEKAMDITDSKSNAKAKMQAKGQFYSSLQRFYNQVITSMSVPSVLADIKKELAAGHSCVIQLVNTNEAAANRGITKAQEEGMSLDDVDMTPSEMLIGYLEKSFPIHQYEDYEDDNGNLRSRPVLDSEGRPVVNKEAVAMRDALIEHVRELKVPEGPLEMIINEFGPEAVAEITGRKRRVVLKNGKKVIEKLTDNTKAADEIAFQSGKKRILIFSDAGGTGRSYHASKSVKNQERRIHYLLQPGWNASNATQGFGRTHRSNQVVAPIFRLVTTNVSGQKRFTSTIAKRLDQLGALTKGQRDTGSGIFSAKDNLENMTAKDALQQFYRKLAKNAYDLDGMDIIRKLGLYDKLFNENGGYDEDLNVVRDTSKFLNRILALEVKEQNKVFGYFTDTVDSVFQKALESGSVDMGVENYVADKLEVAEEITIRKDQQTGAETKYMKLITSQKTTLIPFDLLPTVTGSKLIDLVKIKETGEVRAVYQLPNKTLTSGDIVNHYRLLSPVREESPSTYIQKTMDEKTESIPKKDWRSEWQKQSARAPEYTEDVMYMLTGVLLPVWNKLPDTMTRVRRVMDAEGSVQILGRIIPANQIDTVLGSFHVKRSLEVFTTEQIFNEVLTGHDIVLQDNKQKLVRSRVSGENRIEIVGDNVWFYGNNKIPGVFNERIGSQYRYFIPTDEAKAHAAIERIVKFNPVVEISKNKKTKTDDDVQYSKGNRPTPSTQKFAGQIFTDEGKVSGKAESIFAGVPKNYKSKNPEEIKISIMRNFFVNIHSKNFRRHDGVYAYFKPKHSVIVSRYNSAIGPVAHELGHKLDKMYDLKNNPAIKRMLMDAPGYNKELSERGYKDEEKTGEVVADFIMLYLTNPDAAYELGSYAEVENFYDTFENSLSERDLKNIRDLQRDILMWGAQDSITKGKKTIAYRANGEFATFKQRTDTFMRSVVDDIDGAKQFIAAVNAESENDVAAKNDTYEMLRKTSAVSSITSSILTEKLINPEGFVVGDSLGDVLKGVKQKYMTLFDLYLKDVHSLDWMAQGKRVYSIEMDSEEEIRGRIAKMENEHPEFKETADKYYAWWKNFTQMWLVDTGLKSQEFVDELHETYPHYVPNFRKMDGIKGKGGKVGGDPIKRASEKGSDRMTYSAIENMILQVGNIVKAGVQNQAMTTLHTLYKNPEFSETVGLFLDAIPPDMQVNKFDATGVKTALRDEFFMDAYSKMSEQEKLEFDGLSEKEQIRRASELSNSQVIDDVISDSITYFTAKKSSNDPNVAVCLINGKPKFYNITDDNLAMAFMALEPRQIGGLLRMVKALTRGFIGWTTANNPLFAIANHARDIQHGYVMTESKYSALNPLSYLSYVKDLFVAYGQIISHARPLRKMGIKESENYELYRANAGLASKYMPVGDTFNTTLREINGVRSRHKKTAIGNAAVTAGNVLASAMDLISNFNGAIEAAPRMVAFNRTYKKGGKNADALVKAVHAAKEATVDFQRRGTVTANLSAAIPFVGASIAGIDQFRRITMTKEAWTTKEGRQRLLRAVLSQAIPAILMALIYDGDDDYETLNGYIKDGYWLFKIGEERFIKIPKEREISAIFGTSFQRIVANYLQPELDNKEELASYLEYTIKTFTPAHDVTGWAIIDAMNNKTWYGGTVVSQRDEALMQPGYFNEIYDDTTSRLAVGLASILPDVKSLGALNTPKGIEYVIDQLTGGLGDVLLPATTPTTSGLPSELLRRYMTDSVYSNKYSGEAYDILDELDAAVMYGGRTNTKDKTVEAWQKAFSNTLSGQSDKYVTVSDYYAQIRANNNDQTLTTDEREKLNREARKNINRISEDLVKAYKSGADSQYSFADVVVPSGAKSLGVTNEQYKAAVNATTGQDALTQKYALANMTGLTDVQKSYLAETVLKNSSYDEWGGVYANLSKSMTIEEVQAGSNAVKAVEDAGGDTYSHVLQSGEHKGETRTDSITAGSKQDTGAEGHKSLSRKKKEAIDAAYPSADRATKELLYKLYDVSEKLY